MRRQKSKRFKKHKELVRASIESARSKRKDKNRKMRAAFEMYKVTEDLIKEIMR